MKDKYDMMILQYNTYSKVYAYDNIMSQLDSFLSIRNEGSQFSQAYKSGKWDGYTHFLTKKGHVFPTGLLPMVEKKFNNIKIVDKRIQPKPIELNTKPIPLYPYQEKAFNNFLSLNKERGIFGLAVNWGKSYLISKLIQHYSVKTIIIVHRATLVKQLYETIAKFIDKNQVGIGLSGRIEYKPILITTIQTLKNQDPDSYKNYDMMLVDEAHRVSAKNYYKTCMKIDAYYRFGFTGTAEKRSELDNMKVKAVFGDILLTATIQDTIELNKSAIPTVYFATYPTDFKPMHWQDAYLVHIVQNEDRNELIRRIVEKENAYTLVMVNFIEHGEILSTLLDAPFIYGDDDTDKIMQTLREFNEGKIKTLITSTIADEGLNIARADVVVFAGAGKSPVRLIQRIGRALRKYKGKKHVKIIDFVDNNDTTLLSHTIQRRKVYEAENIEIKDYTL